MMPATDKNDLPIRSGDLLRTFHFVGSRRRKHYLYHVIRRSLLNGRLEAVPVSELANPPTGGRWLITDGKRYDGSEIINSDLDSDGKLHYERKKIR